MTKKQTKAIDVDAADARRATEKKGKALAVVKSQKTKTKDKAPAAVTTKQTELSPYEIGYDDGYKSGFKDSTTRTVHGFVAAVEQKLAEHDGYEDPEKWRREATIPAWWIAVLMTQMSNSKFTIICAWCGKGMGEKPGEGQEGVSHTICPECLKKHFPGHKRKE